MKKQYQSWTIAVLVSMGILTYDVIRDRMEPELERPELVREDDQKHDEEMDLNKTRAWTDEEREEHRILMEEKLRNRQLPPASRASTGMTTLAGGAVTGQWIARGPVGAPGAFEFAEFDDGTDTVYAVSTGHYGGVRNIFKGTVAFSADDPTGDDLRMISGQFPQRWRDIHVYMANGVKRLLGTTVDGPVYYSDDMGKTWTKSNGLSDIMKNTIRNRQENDRLYTCDNQKVYVSDDGGESFTVLQDFGTSSVMRLYTPRYEHQPGAEKVFLFRDGKVWALNGSSFTTVGTFDSSPASINDNSKVQLQGDERYLYAYYQKSGEKESYFMVSTNGGASFVRRHPRSAYYNEPSGTATAFSWFGVHPDTPSIAILGYAHPTISLDGGQRDMVSKDGWGSYQTGHNTWDNQTFKLRNYYHPDFQGGHYFYDKNGKLFSLRAGDGGLFVSRNEWEEGHYPGDYYNFTVQAPVSNGETYARAMTNGFRNPYDFALGTQDQGWQTSTGELLEGTTHAKVLWDGGDGGPLSSGPDGEYAWKINGDRVSGPITIYSGDTFNGCNGTNRAKLGAETSVSVKGHWFDLKDYSTTLWILNSSVQKFVSNGYSLSQSTISLPGSSGNIAALCQSPSNQSIFWAMNGNKVYKSTNGGTSFTQVATVAMTASTAGGDVRGWAFDDNTVLFAGKGSGATSVLSTDGGSTFSVVEGLPNTNLSWMQGDKTGSIAMASTKIGPYLFDLGQKQWFDAAGDYENGAPYFSGQWGAYDSLRNVFRFSTWGQGVWDFAIDDGSPKLTVTAIGKSYKAGETIPVQWSSNLTGSVTIELLKDGVVAENLGSVAVGDGEFNWTVPSDLDMGSVYSFRVSHDSKSVTTTGFTLMIDYLVLDQYHLSIDTVDSEHSSDRAAALTIDGDPATFWHTMWGTGEPVFPHFIVYELDTTVTLVGFQYVPRTDQINGTVQDYEILLSDDGENWTSVKAAQFPISSTGADVFFDQFSSARFVKFLAKSEVNGNNWASMAEFNLFYLNEDVASISPVSRIVNRTGVRIVGIASNQVKLAIPTEGHYRVKLYTLDGRVLFNSERSFKAGANTVDLSSLGLARQFCLLSVEGKEHNLVQKISLK